MARDHADGIGWLPVAAHEHELRRIRPRHAGVSGRGRGRGAAEGGRPEDQEPADHAADERYAVEHAQETGHAERRKQRSYITRLPAPASLGRAGTVGAGTLAALCEAIGARERGVLGWR